MCTHGAFRGDGAFGQFAIVMNEQNTTLVMTCGMEKGQELLDSVWDILLPAMGKEPLAENKSEYDKLNKRLSSLELPIEYNEIVDTVQDEIDGKSFVLEENMAGITHVGLEFVEDRANFLMEIDGQRAKAKVGHGKRIYSKMLTKTDKTFLAKATLWGTWVESDKYKLTITYYETPLTVTMLYEFSGDELTLTLSFNISMGGEKSFVVKGKAKE
jgi:hypothetical protein